MIDSGVNLARKAVFQNPIVLLGVFPDMYIFSYFTFEKKRRFVS